jgi:hypothetical protein
MRAEKLLGLAKEAQSILAFCEEGLKLIGRHIAGRASSGTSGFPLHESAMEPETPQAREHREAAELTRAYAGEVRDPEIRRLLSSLADRYEQMALPNGRRGHPTIAVGK